MSNSVDLFLFWFILITAPLSLFAQQNDYYNRKYPPQQLQEDFNQYKTVLEELHPSLYWYTPKTEVDNLMNEVEEKLVREMSEFEFYNLIAPITAKINCGHTGTLPSDEARSTLQNRMPLEFRYVKGKLYLYYDYDTQTKSMKEVASINGHGVEEMLEKISGLKGTDGYIITPQPLFFNNSGSFGFWYNLVYQDTTYKIQFADGSVILRDPISADSLSRISSAFYPQQPLLTYNIKADLNTAVLTINTFEKDVLKNADLKYKKYLADFFKQLKARAIEHLIIDLRNNGGGEDNYASLLYRYLTDEPFQFYKSMEANPLPYDKIITQQVYLPTEVKNSLISKFFIKKKEGRFLVKPTFRTKGLRLQKPKKDHFQGKLYFLVSGATYSAAAELTAFSKAHRPNTVFIGTETGGAMQGNTSALFAFLTLKHTKIGNYIPLVRYTMNVTEYEKGRGVVPDFTVEPSKRGILEEKDEGMAFALELIQEPTK